MFYYWINFSGSPEKPLNQSLPPLILCTHTFLYTLLNSLFQSKCFLSIKLPVQTHFCFFTCVSFMPSTPVPSGSVRPGDQVENLGVLLLVAKVRMGSNSQGCWGQNRALRVCSVRSPGRSGSHPCASRMVTETPSTVIHYSAPSEEMGRPFCYRELWHLFPKAAWIHGRCSS